MTFDVGLLGGTVVIGSGRRATNVYLADGKIAEVSAARHRCGSEFDATGLLVMPGMIDAHVHSTGPPSGRCWVCALRSASAERWAGPLVIEHNVRAVMVVSNRRRGLAHLGLLCERDLKH